MQDAWVTLPYNWDVSEVRAGLNVVITLLAFLASYIYVRLCWQRVATQVHRSNNISLASLLTVSNPGEVLDTILVLGRNILSIRYVGLWAQYLVVCSLTAIAILSGPIARSATRQSTAVRARSVAVSLPRSNVQGATLDIASINATWTRLDNASFPTDRLLETHPSDTVDWAYNPSQWKPDWMLNCSSTQQRNASLRASGRDCVLWKSQFPGLSLLFSPEAYTKSAFDGGGWWDPVTSKYTTAYWVQYGKRVLKYDERNKTQIMLVGMSITTVNGVDIIRRKNTSSCPFDSGSLYNISQTMLSCEMHRQAGSNETILDPTVFDAKNICSNYKTYAYPKFERQTINHENITQPSKDELIRFLQTYMTLTGTIVPVADQRLIDLRVEVTQLSVTFIAIVAVCIAMILLGFVRYSLFAWKHHKTLFDVPLSKIDWMIQSIVTENRPSLELTGRPRWSATVELPPYASSLSRAERRKTEFEAARYNDRRTTTWFLDDGRQKSSTSLSSSNANAGLAYSDAFDPLAADLHNGRGTKLRVRDFTTASAVYPLRTLAGYRPLG